METREWLKDGHYDCGAGDDDVVTAKYKKVFCTVSQLLLLLGRGVSLTKVVIVVRTDSREITGLMVAGVAVISASTRPGSSNTRKGEAKRQHT